MNWAIRLAKYLPLCSYLNIFNGNWTFSAAPRKVNAWASCPLYQQGIIQLDSYARHHEGKFSCLDLIHTKATYRAHECNILPIRDSFQAVASTNKAIVYIGDSLIMQLYLAAQCSAELFGVSQTLKSVVIQDLFLRNDIPCDPRCLTNETFRLQDTWVHPCWACRSGKRKEFSTFETDPDSWHNRLPSSPLSAVVLSSGAWYNTFKGIINSTATYIEMLHKVGPILRSINKVRSAEVFWVGLPPIVIHPGHDNETRAYMYEWIAYADKDRIAKEILQAYGVNFIDTDRLTRYRKFIDLNTSADGMHWW